jgi:hypothetical protein
VSRRVFLVGGVIVLTACGGCWRRHEVVLEIKPDPTPEPITAKAVEPPKPEFIRLGQPPRLMEEPR